MRKVTQFVVGAFLRREKARMGNSATDGITLSLHGNDIATHVDGGIMIDSCGWKSNTTKERLNAIPGVSISQKKGEWYLNGVQWDGKVMFVPSK